MTARLAAPALLRQVDPDPNDVPAIFVPQRNKHAGRVTTPVSPDLDLGNRSRTLAFAALSCNMLRRSTLSWGNRGDAFDQVHEPRHPHPDRLRTGGRASP